MNSYCPNFTPRGIRVGFERASSVFIESRYLDQNLLEGFSYNFSDIRDLFPESFRNRIIGWVYVKPHESNGARLFTFVEYTKSKRDRSSVVRAAPS